MQHVLTPHSIKIEPFAWWDGAFSEDELNLLQTKAAAAEVRSQVGEANGGIEDKRIRRSDVNWVSKNADTAWLFERLGNIVSACNAQYFGFDLTGFGEPIQLTNYNGSEHGMYGWHQDFGGQVSRKLSLVLQLTDPSEYEGGNLELMVGGGPQKMKKQRGLVLAFPSWQLHQVTPVTQGSRQSVVAWVSGPNFK